MALRFYKPYTPGTRNRSVSDFLEITRLEFAKSLTYFFHKSKGRNNRGIITSRHLGKGHKRLYRQIEFKRNKLGIFGTVLSIEYDPNRNSRISLINYVNGKKNYIIQPLNLKLGDTILSNYSAPIKVGNALPLNFIPSGTYVHNIEFLPGCGGKIARSAGNFSEILSKNNDFVIISMPSGEVRTIKKFCWATVGQVGNLEFFNINLGKAGRSRWLGIRPKVRGIAMNPCDHPHGGGEGKSPIGHTRPMTPWGKIALGKKTRKCKKKSDENILKKKKN